MYFLTELDPNVDAKGSRDPLGYQAVWTALGRRLVAHLTTVTTSLRGFSVLLLGLEFAERALGNGGHVEHAIREKERLACFLRFEQLAAYSRHVAHDARDIRGLRRVKRRLQEGSGVVTIGAADRHQILGEQRTYGLWGLYMNAARGSGLVEDGDARLTAIAREYVDRVFLEPLGRSGVADMTRRVHDEARSFEPRGKDRAVARSLGAMLGPTRSDGDRDFMTQTLVHVLDACDTTRGGQRLLWAALGERSRDPEFVWGSRCGYADVAALRDHASTGGEIARSLDAVLAVEPLLAVTETLFGHVVGARRISRDGLRSSLRTTWGSGSLGHLRADAVAANDEVLRQTVGDEGSVRVAGMLQHLRDGDFERVVELLLDQNDAVMRARGGGGWIDRGGSELKATLFQQPVPLPDRAALPTLWRNSYFLDALRWLGADIASLGRAPDGE